MSIERTNPITGTEAQRRWLQANAAVIEAAEEGASIGAQELHTSVDGAGLKRVFRCHENIGRTYHLGTVANEAAMLALDSPLTSHACLPGDTCFRTDTQQTMRCISNYGVSVGDWEVVSSSADPAGTADAAVSTHNTATDSHADIRTLIADRALIEHQHARADLPWVTDPGAALLTAASTSAQRTALGLTQWSVRPWTDGTTSDVPEGTQLYFTTARADSRIEAQKGQAEGLAPLDAGGKVPSIYLPDSVTSFNGRNGAILPIASDYSSFYLGISAQAADSAKLGGVAAANFSQTTHTHNYAGSSAAGGPAASADFLNPISGDANYQLAYAADGQRMHAGGWGRMVMRYRPNVETYGVRVDRADVASDPEYYRIAYPEGGASVSRTYQQSGAIAIRLPVGMLNTMVHITIKVYEFLTGSSFECHVAGYTYWLGNTWVNAPTVYIIGNPNVSRQLNVRLGYDSTLNKAMIYVGELTSVWAYPQVYVTEVLCGYEGYSEAWTSGWQIGFESVAFKNVTATITDCQVGFKTPNLTAIENLSGTAGVPVKTAANTWELKNGATAAVVIGGTTLNFQNGVLMSVSP